MKKVFAKTSSPIIFKNVDVGWSDIWIYFTTKPARKREEFAPTFISQSDLEFDLEFSKSWCADHPLDVEAKRNLDQQQAIFDKLQKQEIVISETKNPYIPDIYINKSSFRRSDAEKMIDAFMKYLGFTGAKVKWQKPPNILAIPVSVRL